VSGDWRDVQRIGKPDEMVGLVAVNAPGFPMPRYAMDGERQVSLLASAGIVMPRKEEHMAINEFPVPGFPVYLDPRYLTTTTTTGTTGASFTIGNPTAFRDADELAAIGRSVADELEYRAERRSKLESAKDADLLREAQERRAAKIAAAKEGID
jgi:hypothetical protein